MTTPTASKATDRTALARWVMVVLLLLSAFCAMWVSEWPHAVHVQRKAAQLTSAKMQKRAAIAIRDHVNPFQKWGTQLFVQPTLQRGYHKVHYFTQFSRYDIKDEYVATLRRALQRHDVVDIFLYIHSSSRYLYWTMLHIKPKLRQKLRLVYNTGCGNMNQGKSWLRIGADAYVGHAGRRSVSPVFAVFFARRWIVGVPLGEAVKQANAAAKPRLMVAGALSFGVVSGAQLWRWTRADLVGERTLSIGKIP